MNFQIFEMKPWSKSDPRDSTATDQLTADIKMAEGLGLDAQAKQLKDKLRSALTRSRFETTPLTPDDFLIWQKWCCNSYEGTRVSEYGAQLIPPAVIKHWGSCKELCTFDEYWVLTNRSRYSEKQTRSESLLIAKAGEDKYLLARWTEPGNDLHSFTDIKMLTWKECVRDATFTEFLFAFAIAAGFLGLMIGLFTNSVIIGIIAGAIAYVYGEIKFRNYTLRDNNVAQALMKDGCASKYGYLPF